MSTKIEWVKNLDGTPGETWSPVTGCTPVSEGCQNCYARRMAKRLAGRYGYPKDEPFKVTLRPERLEEPLRWKKPRMVFVCSMGDLFHEDVPFEFIGDVWDLMLECKWNTFLILTKRPGRMLEFSRWYEHWYDDFAADHIWLGVTAENQEMADERIPILLQIPAAVRFVSVEPMLGLVDLSKWLHIWKPYSYSPWVLSVSATPGGLYYPKRLHWIITGGESGPGARPMHPDWVRSLRDQCVAAGVPFFFKSWGEWANIPGIATHGLSISGDLREFTEKPLREEYAAVACVGKKAAGRLLDGREWNEMPEVKV